MVVSLYRLQPVWHITFISTFPQCEYLFICLSQGSSLCTMQLAWWFPYTYAYNRVAHSSVCTMQLVWHGPGGFLIQPWRGNTKCTKCPPLPLPSPEYDLQPPPKPPWTKILHSRTTFELSRLIHPQMLFHPQRIELTRNRDNCANGSE